MRVLLARTIWLCLLPLLTCAAADTASSPAPCGVQPPGGQWSAAAPWIAGTGNSAFAASLTPEQRDAWADFSKSSEADWTRLRRQYLDRIDAWRSHNLANVGASVAFYPFGGPDAANLFAFYPDAREYVLVGLEPAGCIPSSIADYTPDYFTQLRTGLSSVVALGFFRVDDMRRDVTNSNLSGVLPLLLFLVQRSGMTITDVTSIGIPANGAMGPAANLTKPETLGVAIQFTDARHGSRTLRYFALNLENSRLKRKPGTMKYLQSLPQTVTLVKAAEYLMHKPYFSTIRSTILTKSSIVVEEDSGIPYHYFEPANWDVRLFGTYSEPIKLFKDWSQDDLKTAYAGPGVQPLDFALGYRRRGQANLLVAVRKTK